MIDDLLEGGLDFNLFGCQGCGIEGRLFVDVTRDVVELAAGIDFVALVASGDSGFSRCHAAVIPAIDVVAWGAFLTMSLW